MDASAISSRLIGLLIVEKGLITEAQLQLALDEQQATGARLGEILMSQFGVTRADLESALTAQQAENRSLGAQEDSEANAAVRELARMLDEWGRGEPEASKRPIGEIFVEKGFITSGQLEDALDEQKLSGRKLGEILVSQGKLSRLRLWDALEDQAASFEPQKKEPSGTGKPSLRVVSDALTGHVPEHRASDGVEMWQPNVEPTEQADDASVDEAVNNLREELAALTARLDALPQPSEEWREAVSELRGRLDELAAGSAGSESTLRRLAEQLDVERDTERELDAQVGALTQRLEQLAGEVTDRLDRLAASVTTAAGREQTDALRHDLDQLRTTIDALPAPTGDVDELASRLAGLDENLNARLQHVSDHLAAAATREQAERLRRELDDLRAALDALPAPTDDVDTLGRRVEHLSESFSSRLQQLSDTINAAAGREQTDALRHDLDQLRTTIDALPRPTDEWRGTVDSLWGRIDELASGSADARSGFDHLHARIDAGDDNGRRLDERLDAVANVADDLTARLEQLSHSVADAATHDQADALRSEVDDLRRRLDSLPAPTEEWREAIAALAVQIDSTQSSDEWRDAVAALAVRLDDAAPAEELRAELRSLSDRLRERVDRIERDLTAAATTEGVEAVAHQVDEVRGGIEQHSRRLEQVVRRLDELAPLHRVDELANATTETASAHGAALDAIREELSGQARKLQEVAEKRRADKAAHRERLDALEATVSNGPDLGAALEPLQAHVADLDRRLSQLDQALGERLDRLQSSVEEHTAGHDDERRAELDTLLNDIYRRIEEVAATSAGRAELDALRRQLEEEVTELLERQGQDGAAAQATGEAIRDGLAELARRLTASEQAYFESGRSLRRSIEGLGLAITEADWHLQTGAAGEKDAEASSYVAFVPAGDAYRLVECDGPPPYLGQIVDIEGFEDAMLRVSRLGRSPLPFDGRPCAYLERLSPATA